ncbi:hypothetical protein KF840_25800 [bacterium]|nr:hypothetical protein [bacterium]
MPASRPHGRAPLVSSRRRRTGNAARPSSRAALQLLALSLGVTLAAALDEDRLAARMTCADFLDLAPSRQAGIVARIEGDPSTPDGAHGLARRAAALAAACRGARGRRVGDLQPRPSARFATGAPLAAN